MEPISLMRKSIVSYSEKDLNAAVSQGATHWMKHIFKWHICKLSVKWVLSILWPEWGRQGKSLRKIQCSQIIKVSIIIQHISAYFKSLAKLLATEWKLFQWEVLGTVNIALFPVLDLTYCYYKNPHKTNETLCKLTQEQFGIAFQWWKIKSFKRLCLCCKNFETGILFWMRAT